MIGSAGSGQHDIAGPCIMAAAAAETGVDLGPDIFANCFGMAEITFRLVTKLIMILHRMGARSCVRCMTIGTETAVLAVGLVINFTGCAIDKRWQTVRSAGVTVGRLCKADQGACTGNAVVTGLTAAAAAPW